MKLPVMKKSELTGLDKWKFQRRRYLNDGELEVLLTLIENTKPKIMIEFGVNEGLTARSVLENIPSIEKYIGVDVPRGYVTEKPTQRGEVPRDPALLVKGNPKFKLILRPRGSLDLVPSDLGPCDVIFIDGDHGRKAVTRDSAMAIDLVQPGGIIIWHDYHTLETVDVRAVLDELYDGGRKIMRVENTWLAFERR